MESVKNDVSKLPQMVPLVSQHSSMCGDHPSVTKADGKDEKDKERAKEKFPMSYARISPTSSSTDRTSKPCARADSDHVVRRDARRRVLSDAVARGEMDVAAPPDRSLVQAALGSFRWPPYLLAVWVLVLLLTHALHAMVAVLERCLPTFKKFCQYFRAWTEESWRAEKDRRVYPASLAFVTVVLYAAYFLVYAVHAACVWAIEPLCSDLEDEPKVTEYAESKTSVPPNVA